MERWIDSRLLNGDFEIEDAGIMMELNLAVLKIKYLVGKVRKIQTEEEVKIRFLCGKSGGMIIFVHLIIWNKLI